MPPQKKTETQQPGAAYAVHGAELFLRRRAVADLIERILGPADRALALSEYDAAETMPGLADVLDDLRTLPFLTDRRLVLVRAADEFVSLYRGDLEQYLAAPAPTGVLLLDCKSLPSNTRLHRRIAEIGQVVECKPLKAWAVPGWLIEHCRSVHGKALDARAAALLCDQIGNDLGLLDSEVQKLTLYVADRRSIGPDDVEKLTGRCREEQVWDILSAIGAGNRPKALGLWEEVWQTDRAASDRAIGGLAYTVRRLLTAKRAQEAGASRDELCKIMMIWHDDRLTREINAFAAEELELMHTRLLEADVAGKTGAASVRSAIESFIIEMCGRRASRRATG
ncbi:MAG TPA: DNA polymerase III subunit delta [Phycisphaerae bacterium]|nr:DNA polymerase III subunit delta [Phycisphaerae bacterium]